MSRDRKLGIAFILLGIAIVLGSQQITLMNKINEPGPKVFPIISGLGIIGCSLAIVFGKQQNEDKKQVFLTKEGWKKFIFIFCVLIAYAVALHFLGFVISTPFATLGFIKVLKEEKKVNWIVCILLSLILGFGLYYTFEKVFLISLPGGIFFV